MKDAINYFIPIIKDPINDITGRCMTNNGLDNTYCGSYQFAAAKVINPTTPINQPTNTHYPDVQMETNSMEIQYNNHIEMDECQESQEAQAMLQLHQQQRLQHLQQNRKRNNYDCDIDSIANAKRCRRDEPDPTFFLPPDQAASPFAKTQPMQNQTHQRRPTHNIPDMPRCMMGHYV